MPRTRVKLPAPEPANRLPAGTLVCRVVVPGRACPWSVPVVTRSGVGVKKRRLVDWQKLIQLYARIAMGQRPPYGCPVRLALHFELRPRAGRMPDTTNLQKGSEDALQGIILLNDSQVHEVRAVRTVGGEDRTTIEVVAL